VIGWGIALALLAAIWFFPIGVLARYDGSGPRVKIILGLLRLQVFPWKRKKREKKPKEKKTAVMVEKKQEKPPEQSGGSLKDFLPLLRQVVELLLDFREILRVNRLEIHVVMAGGAPDALAANYGRAWAALGALDGKLEDAFHIRRKVLDMQCDFCGTQSSASGHLELTVTLGRLLCLSIRHGRKILPMLFRIQKIRKGGATQ